MKQLKTLLFHGLFLFYLSSSYLSATHFHDNSLNANSECKVCIIVKNLNSGDSPSHESNGLVYGYSDEPIAYNSEKIQKDIQKGFNANAPPLS